MAQLRKNAFEVQWRIENANSWFEAGYKTLYSPQFLAETLMNTRWKLVMNIDWQLEEKYASLTVQRDVEDSGPEFIALHYELSLLACDESHVISKSCKSRFALKTRGHGLNVKYGEIFKDYVPGGVLTMCCKFWFAWSPVSKGGGQCLIRNVIGLKNIVLDGSVNNFNMLDEKRQLIVNFVSPASEIGYITLALENRNGIGTFFEKKHVMYNQHIWYSCKLYVYDARGQKHICCDERSLGTLLNPHSPCRFQPHYNWNSFRNFSQTGRLRFQLEIKYYPGVETKSIDYLVNNFEKVAGESPHKKNMKSSNSGNLSLPECKKACKKRRKLEEMGSIDKADCFATAGRRHLPSSTLKEDLTCLYNDRLFCDTKLQTRTETFPAHRSVLSARSPVFKKMFSTDMKEAAGESIYIPDISTDTVRRMLQFIYTDCTGDLEMQTANDLYIASDKYDIPSLKQQCVSFMKENLCTANVCEVLVLADTHQDKDLESAAHEFVLTYGKEVLGSEEWKLFMKNFSSLAAQVMYFKCMEK